MNLKFSDDSHNSFLVLYQTLQAQYQPAPSVPSEKLAKAFKQIACIVISELGLSLESLEKRYESDMLMFGIITSTLARGMNQAWAAINLRLDTSAN